MRRRGKTDNIISAYSGLVKSERMLGQVLFDEFGIRKHKYVVKISC